MPSSQSGKTNVGVFNPLLAQDLKEWKKICPSIQVIEVSDKGFLYHQGERRTTLFWVKEGIVKLSCLTLEGTALTLALLQPGDIFGRLQEDSAIQAMDESAQALGNVVFYSIEHEDFKKLLSYWPGTAWHIFETIYARQQRIERKFRAILTQSVEKRVISTLLELAEIFGTRCTHGYSLEIFLTQQELADLVGASRSVVSTLMNDFRSQGMLDYTREQICINDVILAHNDIQLL